MNFRQVEAFRAVMLTGSMTEAAEMLGVSQPGVSRLIAQLETAIKMKLFIRGSPRLQPTAEAIAFHTEVERIFSSLQRLDQVARDIRFFGTGHLRIACLPALALGFLPRVIKRFSATHPDVRITLQARSSSTVHEWAASQQCDFGIAAPGPDIKGVQVERFLAVPGVCILPPGHRLAERDTLTPADLAGERFISLGLSDPTRSKIDRVFAEAGVERVLTLETQYAATISAMVVEGLGISIINPFVAPDFLARGIEIRRFHPKIVIEKMLLFPSNRPRSRLTDAFIAVLKTCRDEELAAQQALLDARSRQPAA